VVVLLEKLSIASDLAQVGEVRRRVLEEVARKGYSSSAAFAIRLALEEGLNNAVLHGNGRDPNKHVEIAYDVDPKQVRITIRDEGEGFDPEAVPDPRADENLEKPCGRGLMLMRAYMDEVRFNRRGNQVRMVKRNN